MARLVLTGASGYIGRRLLQMAQAQGHAVVVLGSKAPGGGVPFCSWKLGDAAAPAALSGAAAVIHLAHSWRADSQSGDNLNAEASALLAQGALAAGVPRFIFASTTSARPTALNAYGRRKYALEERLAGLPDAAGRVVSARIALVYGGPPAGQYALMRKLTALTPVLPMLGLEREIQPIYLDEVCQALLTLALNPRLGAPYYVVGGEPMRFGQWLKLLRKAQTGGGLLLIPLPLKLMLLACDIFRFLPRERVLGLAGAEPMASRESLKALQLVPGDPFTLLRGEDQNAGGREARALLRYLGARPLSAGMEQDLVRGLAQAGLTPLGLAPLLLRRPGLIALVEPPANRQSSRLAQALYLAAQVMEAHAAPRRRPGLMKTGLLVARDLLMLPVHLVTARRNR